MRRCRYKKYDAERERRIQHAGRHRRIRLLDTLIQRDLHITWSDYKAKHKNMRYALSALRRERNLSLELRRWISKVA